jgi:hypothetical protein
LPKIPPPYLQIPQKSHHSPPKGQKTPQNTSPQKRVPDTFFYKITGTLFLNNTFIL